MRIFIIKYCCWGGGAVGLGYLARDLGLQLGLFYKNWGRNIFEFGAPIGAAREEEIWAAIGIEIFLNYSRKYRNFFELLKI
jgi:hypothetical protein